jgi:hypothetical protein
MNNILINFENNEIFFEIGDLQPNYTDIIITSLEHLDKITFNIFSVKTGNVIFSFNNLNNIISNIYNDIFRINYLPFEDYKLEININNLIKVINFSTPKINKRYDSWIWNDSSKIWECPIQYPGTETLFYRWCEDIKNWKLIPIIEKDELPVFYSDYSELRKNAYPPISKQLDALYHYFYNSNIENDFTKMINKIKAKYPKPEIKE